MKLLSSIGIAAHAERKILESEIVGRDLAVIRTNQTGDPIYKPMEIEDKSCLMMMSRIGDKCIVDASDDEQSDVLSLQTSQESFFDFFSADIYAEAPGDKISGKTFSRERNRSHSRLHL